MSYIVNSPRLAVVGGGLSIVSFTDDPNTWAGTGTGATTLSSVAVQTNDVIVIFGMSEDSTRSIGTPSDGSNTYTNRQSNATASNCWSGAWTATAGSSTNLNIQATPSGGTGKKWGICGFIVRGGVYKTSSKETNTTEAPQVNLTTTVANSVVLWCQADWNAIATTGKTYLTNAGTAVERVALLSGTNYTVYVISHANAGSIATKAIGMSAPSGQKTSQIAVEIG